MTMLSVVQDFCGRTGVPVPTTVYGTTDPQAQQAMKLLEEEGDDLAKRNGWQGITFEASHTTTAAEDQGAITTIASNGFGYIKNDTLWDRTTRIPVCGPLNARNWQWRKSLAVSGSYYNFRIRGGKLLINPVPPASESWFFEYVSKNWILGADGTTYKKRFTLDTDTILLPEDLILQGLRWRWKKEKGLEYAEDFNTYEQQVNAAIARDGGKETLNMGESPQRGRVPGVFVPSGNWNV